jgi:hypothetical protein
MSKPPRISGADQTTSCSMRARPGCCSRSSPLRSSHGRVRAASRSFDLGRAISAGHARCFARFAMPLSIQGGAARRHLESGFSLGGRYLWAAAN